MQRGFGQRGAVLPLVAICLAVLMGFAGTAVDIGYWEYQEREQQNAADAAALGGAQQLVYSNCSGSTAQAAAWNDAANNGFPNGGSVTVAVQNPPSSGVFANNNCAVDVQITRSGVPSFFSRVFGRQSVTETTEAVATVSANGNGCIYLLNPSTASIFNGDNVNAPWCSMLINDTATFNGDPKFEASKIGYAGGPPIENGTTFVGATPAPMLPVQDPCPEIAGCNYLTQNPPAAASNGSCVSKTYNGLVTAFLSPGCYNSLIVNGCANVVFSPGTYVFNGTTIINGEQSVTGSAVTLYVTANGTAPTFNGINSLSLSAPSSGSDVGVLFYEASTGTQNPVFNGTTQNLSGLIYAPGANNAIFNGTSGSYLVIVVGAATFNGSSAYDVASPPPNGSLIHQAVLAQ